jgi:predicted RNase H-like HicB family nuclease
VGVGDGGAVPAVHGRAAVNSLEIVVKKFHDGYVAYPPGLRGVVIGEGDTYEAALSDARSAIRFHVETFGEDVLSRHSWTR